MFGSASAQRLGAGGILIAMMMAASVVLLQSDGSPAEGGLRSLSGAVAAADSKIPLAKLNNAVVEEGNVDGQATLAVRSERRMAGPRPLALMLHGAGATRRTPIQVNAQHFTQSLIDSGWIVAASDAGGDAWGAPSSQRQYLELLTKLRGQFPIGGVVLISLSMGGIPGLQLAANGSIPDLLGWVGITPVTNLPAMAADPRFSANVKSALNAVEISYLDPLTISASRLSSIPLVVTESPGHDPWTPPDQQVTPFVTRMRSANPVSVIDCTDGHVGADCYPTGVVLAMARK